LFAIMATMLRQRTRELAIRMALGATSSDVRRMVVVRGIALAGAGAVIGVVGALFTSRLLSRLLFEIRPTDGITLSAVAGLMLAVAALASYVPARSGMRIQPVTTLRSESE
jgi:ABC-type antimicrobial peptide transport system permease subunit